jgi:plasmid stabilization system protein ParE
MQGRLIAVCGVVGSGKTVTLRRLQQINDEKMIDFIEGKVTPLAFHPHIGRRGHQRGTCELVAHESYAVVYRMLAKKIEILRVKHT